MLIAALSLSALGLFPANLPAPAPVPSPASTPDVSLEPGASIVLMGNALAERIQHDGWFETLLHGRLPDHGLTVRNLGFSADELTVQQRTQGFGTWDDYLTRCEADVILAFFGYNESFAGDDGVESFTDDLREFVRHTLDQTYNGSEAPTLVLVSSIPFEDIGNPLLPEARGENDRIRAYNAAIKEVASETDAHFIDVFTPMRWRYREGGDSLTINGIHLNELGNRVLAGVLIDALGVRFWTADAKRSAAVRELVLEKNLMWFNRYRATDGYNVYGGRSTLEYDGVTNYEVLQRELEVLDAMCIDLDKRIHAVAQGDADPGASDELPAQIPVATNKPGEGPDGTHLFLEPDDAIEKMTVAEGMSVNLYADEVRFPRLVNPVQMSWDTRGRLWVAVWPTYPHWQPGTEMNDALLIVEDDDGDGVADNTKVFADGLHNPTGFEFWNGGVFVANPPDLLYLRDTDGDDVADQRIRVLHGLSSADTHHSANSFVLGPDGALYFQEGIFHQSQIETIYGPMRSVNACAWRFDPRSWRVDRYMAYDFLNPHGHVYDRWGQDFITDGTGNVNYYALPATGFLEQPDKHPSYFPFFQQRSRPAAGTEILSSSHFPEENQGNYLIANVIGFQGIFQYELHEDGSGFRAEEVEPIVYSSDPRFRPSDLEVGPDGALYFLDWHNPLIGHMQHHLRDPSRDHAHGRVYRVTCDGRELTTPEDLMALSIDELLQRLESPDDRVRYRARIELTRRPLDVVQETIQNIEAELNQTPAGREHIMLERLWAVGGWDNYLSRSLLSCNEPRAVAATWRLLRWMRNDYLSSPTVLKRAVEHDHPRVRLEGVVALSDYAGTKHGAEAAQLAVTVLWFQQDRFLDYALEETIRVLEPDWKPALLAGEMEFPFKVGPGYLLQRCSVDELAGMSVDGQPAHVASALYRELLRRPMLPVERYRQAASDLATLNETNSCAELLQAIDVADRSNGGHADHLVMGLFDAMPDACDQTHANELRELAVNGRRATTRRRATARRLQSVDEVAAAWQEGAATSTGLVDLLDAAALVTNEDARGELFRRSLEIVNEAPDTDSPSVAGRYVRVELPGEKRTLTLAEVEVLSNGTNVAPAGTATQSSVNWGGVPERAIDGDTNGAWGAGSQSHTVEDRADPWWEVDLGSEQPIDSIVLWNRTDGTLGRRLDGYVVKLLDGERRTVHVERGGDAPEESHAIELADPVLSLRRAALEALTALGTREDEAVAVVTGAFGDPTLRMSAARAARSVPFERWPEATRDELATQLGSVLEATSAETLATDAGRELLALAEELTPHVAEGTALALRNAAGRAPLVLLVRPVRDRMLYDRTELTVPAGRRIELVFENVDIMPHNLVLTARGALATVGMAAEAMASDPDAWSRSYVPELDEVIAATRLLQPGESETLSFEAPSEPGDYPYVCTFPGHWVRMNGTLHVVPADQAVEAPAPIASDASSAPARDFVKDWKTSDFRRELRKLKNVDAERGRAIYEEATCILCHKVADDVGGQTGPDMRQIARTNGLSEILTQVFEPSKRIAEGYASEIFVTTDGLIHSGRVLEETDEFVLVQDDPYRDDGLEIPKNEIEERTLSNVSAMPSGLLSTFEKGEILDLVAFIKTLKSDS